MKLKDILESTVSGGYPDDGSTGPASDDDLPTGTTIFGDKFVPEVVPNRLTGSTIKYSPATDDWNYDEYEHAMGMGSEKSYSKTLDSLKSLLGDRLWKHTDKYNTELSPDKAKARRDSEVDQTSKLNKDDEETMDTKDITEKITTWIGEEEIINENTLSANDRKSLSKSIIKSENAQLKLKSINTNVNVTNYDDEVVLSYLPNDDLTLALVDIADSLGMEFDKKKDGKKTAFVLEK